YDLDNLNFLLVNDAAIIKYGYTREEFLKMNLKDIRPVEDVDKLLDDVKKSSGEISFSGEWHHKNNKGNIFLVEIISHSIIFNQKNARLLLANDITERKRAEEALRESELRFRSVWEKSTDGMRITNEEGIVVLVNDAYCKIVEKPHEEIEGKPMSTVYEEAKRTDVLQKHQERFRSRSIPAHLERELVLWNGKRTFLELSNTFLENSHQPTLSLSVFKDISERKRAEDELRLRETYQSAIIENQPGLVWLKNAEGRFLAVNNAFALSCGKQSAEEVLGKTDNDLWPPELAEKYRKDDEQVMQNAKPISIEELIIDKGEEKWFETFKTPVIDLEGKIIGTTGFAKDISERKRAEEKIHILSSRQQAILASVPDIIMEVDNNKIYTWANAAGLEFFGDDVIGKNASLYFEGEQETYNTVKPLFNGSENIIYVESWQRRKDGEKRLLAWWCKVLKDEKGKVTGALSSAQDITEHKLAEETLKKSEESYRFIVESTKAVIYHLKYSTMKYDYINPA
ncbi:MAG: PAS domain S-box protein, partial [Ignavibacteria bacterium]|nr:PAS domain S-box protein [Ignavibacteria bacterium]